MGILWLCVVAVLAAGCVYAPSRATDEPLVLSPQVQAALKRAGANRNELLAALKKVPADQLEGMEFLIANMPDRDLTALKADFLLEINVDYAGEKFLGGAVDVFDAEGSIAAVREYILECRRDAGLGAEDDQEYEAGRYQRERHMWMRGEGPSPGQEPTWFCWTRDRAREEWKLARAIESDGFEMWCGETSIDPAYEIGYSTRMDPLWRQFWDLFWEPHIRPELRKLAKVAA